MKEIVYRLNRWDGDRMVIITAARMQGEEPYKYLEVLRESGDWIPAYVTKDAFIAQGFIDTEEGTTATALSDPNDPDGPAIGLENVEFCPQGAALLLSHAKDGKLNVPSVDDAFRTLASLRKEMKKEKDIDARNDLE